VKSFLYGTLMKLLLCALALAGLSLSSLAETSKLPGAQVKATESDLAGGERPERGWFFFESDPKPDEPEIAPPRPPMTAASPSPPKDEKCRKKETWKPDCGFVNPGDDFQFQEKQRDELMQSMSVAQNDPKAVEAFQYYMRWVLERTAEVTNLWWYNMVQNPDLDPNVSSPVSAFGLRLMTEVQRGKDKEIFELVKSEGGFFVYFSRTDCEFCHDMQSVMHSLARETGLEVRNASLDEQCMPGFELGCMTAPQTTPPAQALQVSTVPAVFLYIKPNTWLRISTGVVDVQSMVTRTVQFFSAYRSALLTEVDNGIGGRPSVNFSGIKAKGNGSGAVSTGEGNDIKLPSQEDISKMLGAGKR
jgi:hypothetical protein